MLVFDVGGDLSPPHTIPALYKEVPWLQAAELLDAAHGLLRPREQQHPEAPLQRQQPRRRGLPLNYRQS